MYSGRDIWYILEESSDESVSVTPWPNGANEIRQDVVADDATTLLLLLSTVIEKPELAMKTQV